MRALHQALAAALLSSGACLVGAAEPLRAQGYVPFPSAESLREVQLVTIACARENSEERCKAARDLADPLLDHPRLPASCKDLLWSITERARTASSNSFERRAAITDPAERILLVCRSAEKPAPDPKGPGASPEKKKSGFGFGGS
ncbi:MAG: hypothetical protein ACKOFN_07080 [Vulcanococcus sp.]